MNSTKAGKPLFDAQLQLFLYSEDGTFGYPSFTRCKQCIKHFASTYGDEYNLPPYWMMVERATMGTLELLFSKVLNLNLYGFEERFGCKPGSL